MNRALLKWHRRIGITSSLFVFVLAVTGLLLLLAEPLKLGQLKLANPLIAKVYRTAPQNGPIGFKLQNQKWVVMVDGLVYIGAADPIFMSPPLVGAFIQEDDLIAFSNGEETFITLQDGTLVERMTDHTFTMQAPMDLPDSIKAAVLRRYRGHGVPAARVLLDVHTGSFFGKLGPWIMGIASIFLIMLSISGVIMWSRPNKRKRQRTKAV